MAKNGVIVNDGDSVNHITFCEVAEDGAEAAERFLADRGGTVFAKLKCCKGSRMEATNSKIDTVAATAIQQSA